MDTKNKNILYIVHSYHSFQKDSIELLAKNFKNVYVIVRYKPIAEISRLFPIKKLLNHRKSHVIQSSNKPKNVHIYTVPLWYLPTKFFYNILGDYHFREVDKIIKGKKLKFDIIHAHFTWTAGYVAAKLKEKYHKPFVVTVHEDAEWFREEIESKNQKIYFVWKTADTIIRVNRETVKDLKRYNKNTVYLSNGFNQGLFEPMSMKKAREILSISSSQTILLSVGHLEGYKGQSYLIDAMAILIDKYNYDNIKLYIIGEGSLRRALENQIEKTHMSKYIELLGSKLHKDVPIWMNSCDIFVLPSLAESFGIVQLEAFACGKPVVATKNEGSKEVVISENLGYLCKIGDEKDLARALDLAIKREWDEKEIINHTKDFTWENVLEGVLDIYKTILAK